MDSGSRLRSPSSGRPLPSETDGALGRNGNTRIPQNASGPVFREPWHAQAFAMALSLTERGIFTRAEWAAALGAEIKMAQAVGDPDTGETYYDHWLAALERLVAAKGLADAQTLARTRKAWRRACARTPHGMPIELQSGDFGD